MKGLGVSLLFELDLLWRSLEGVLYHVPETPEIFIQTGCHLRRSNHSIHRLLRPVIFFDTSQGFLLAPLLDIAGNFLSEPVDVFFYYLFLPLALVNRAVDFLPVLDTGNLKSVIQVHRVGAVLVPVVGIDPFDCKCLLSVGGYSQGEKDFLALAGE